jgi:hypothetical protein
VEAWPPFYCRHTAAISSANPRASG